MDSLCDATGHHKVATSQRCSTLLPELNCIQLSNCGLFHRWTTHRHQSFRFINFQILIEWNYRDWMNQVFFPLVRGVLYTMNSLRSHQLWCSIIVIWSALHSPSSFFSIRKDARNGVAVLQLRFGPKSIDPFTKTESISKREKGTKSEVNYRISLISKYFGTIFLNRDLCDILSSSGLFWIWWSMKMNRHVQNTVF